MFQFPCPHCAIPLRLRDRNLRDRQIDCPECQQPVLIRETESGNLFGEIPEQTSSLPQEVVTPRSNGIGLPVMLGLGVIVAVGLYFWVRGNNAESVAETPIPEETTGDPVVQDAADSDEGTEPDPQHEDEDSVPPAGPQDVIEEKFQQIHLRLARYLSEQDTFPTGSVGSLDDPQQRLSWLAKLESEYGAASPPVNWSTKWNAPENDEFIRRRVTPYDNPLIERRAGQDRLPASHFAGISGYGPVAASLPISDPRAGIFGWDRQTRLSDVKDGTANTMLVAGVATDLGSWAHAGHSTMRGFTKEPYVNGPDGFSTGQQDSMLVLMADGSVRTVLASTEPFIIRRMAAMNDGVALDAPPETPMRKAKPEEPEKPESPEASEPIVPMVVAQESDDRLAKRLQIKLAKYELPRPIPLKQVLAELEEFLQMRLDTSKISDDLMATEIQVNLNDATLQDVLDEVLNEAELRADIQPDRILIMPKTD